MAGILRLNNTSNTGQTTLTSAATTDRTLNLPDADGTLLVGADTGAFADGTSVAPSITFASDLDTGIYRPATNEIGLVTGGAERVRVDSSGNLGLGVSDNMDQAGSLYIVGGQSVRWTHPTDGTIYGDHYVSSSGAHVFRNSSNLVSNLVVYPTYTQFQSVRYKTWTDTGAANGVTETLPLMSWNATNNSRIYGEFNCWAARSGGNQQRGYIRYAVGMTYYGGGYSGFLDEVDRQGVAGFSTLVIERSGDDIQLRHVGNTAATGATMLIEFRGSFANGASFN
jgi:hypothetical protein